MTIDQYRQWKDFALRMAKTHWTERDRPNRTWVSETVEEFFLCVLEGLSGDVQDWVFRIRNWDDTDNNMLPKDRYGHTQIGPYVCDEVSLFLDNLNPYRWSDNEKAEDGWDDRWGGAVRCCVRAGLDVFASPSGGVVGFTAGDIKMMYPDGLPAAVLDYLLPNEAPVWL